MSTITSLGAGDTGATSRGVINTNFTNLNSDKIETSVLDTDGTLAANSDAKLATQKAVKTYVDANTLESESTTGTTHSLTTLAGQKVLVIAKGNLNLPNASSGNVKLNYNGVEKDDVDLSATYDATFGFCLTYTETPGAATQNVTVTTTGGTLGNVRIAVMKF